MANKKVLIVEDQFPHDGTDYLQGNSYIYCLNREALKGFREHQQLYESSEMLGPALYEKPMLDERAMEDLKQKAKKSPRYAEQLAGIELYEGVWAIDGLKRLFVMDVFRGLDEEVEAKVIDESRWERDADREYAKRRQKSLQQVRQILESKGIDLRKKLGVSAIPEHLRYVMDPCVEGVIDSNKISGEIYETLVSDYSQVYDTIKFWQELNETIAHPHMVEGNPRLENLVNWMNEKDPEKLGNGRSRRTDYRRPIDSNEMHCNIMSGGNSGYSVPTGWCAWQCMPVGAKLQFMTKLAERTSGKSGVELLLAEDVDDAKRILRTKDIDYIVTDLGMPLSTDSSVKPRLISSEEATKISNGLAPEIKIQVEKYSPFVRGIGFSRRLKIESNTATFDDQPLDKIHIPQEDDLRLNGMQQAGGIEVVELAAKEGIPYTVFTTDFGHARNQLFYLLAKGHLSPRDIGSADGALNSENRVLYGQSYLGNIRNAGWEIQTGVSESGRLAFGSKRRLNPWITTLTKVFEKIGE